MQPNEAKAAELYEGKEKRQVNAASLMKCCTVLKDTTLKLLQLNEFKVIEIIYIQYFL